MCLCLDIYFCLGLSPCRLFVQTVSHEPLLGPEAVLEGGEARREHGHGAPQQAPRKQSDNTFALHTDLSSGLSDKKEGKGQSYVRLMVDVAEMSVRHHEEHT